MTTRMNVVDELTVGQVAELYGVTVRTLHHYDDIGLLRPSARSSAGYRLYTPDDLGKLAQIVVYRRLELPLEEIRGLLQSGDTREHLLRQRHVVMTRLDELHELVDAIDRALEMDMADQPLTAQEMQDLFGESFEEHQAEAEQRWGDTDAWKQSQRRTAQYTKADWERIKAESDELYATFGQVYAEDLPADSADAMDAAEAHRQHIVRWFYDCPPAMHRCLGDLFGQDPRYSTVLPSPESAEWVRAAFHANADRQEALS